MGLQPGHSHRAAVWDARGYKLSTIGLQAEHRVVAMSTDLALVSVESAPLERQPVSAPLPRLGI